MRVVGLSARIVEIPLRKPIQHASHTRTSTQNIVVECQLDDGTTGFGEGVPREYVTGESANSALEHLSTSNFQTLTQSLDNFADTVALCESFQLAAIPDDDRLCHGNAARCAVELALLDAFGKHFDKPLSQVTKMIASDLYQPKEKIQYSGAITSTKGFKLRLATWKYKIFGFQQMKIKVGIAGQDDVKRLKFIRSRFGPKIDLRIDANEAWTAKGAIAKIRELEPFGISSVEQPIPHEEVDALASIREQINTPIMLDESLCSMTDAQRSVTGKYCDLFNIRISKCGGLIPSLRLAQFANANGLGYQLGCQVGETAILSAAGRHFATSVARIRYLEGSYDRHLVKEALSDEDMTFGWGGWASALARPGLGININRDSLEKVTVRKEVLLG